MGQDGHDSCNMGMSAILLSNAEIEHNSNSPDRKFGYVPITTIINSMHFLSFQNHLTEM
jgi:hypothetical protein